MRHLLSSVLAALLLLACEPATADSAIRVVDGDGLKIGGQSIRLWGIDAPEIDQICNVNGRETPCGEDARFLLGALVMAGDLACETKSTDRYQGYRPEWCKNARSHE